MILNIDCLEYMKNVEDETFDLIIADPPYFKICGEFDFKWKTIDEYLEWSKKWILECKRILKSNGSFYLWGGIGRGNNYPFPRLAIWIEENNIFHVVNWITQRNTRGYGCYKGFVQAREELLYCVKDKNNFTWNTAYTEELSERSDLGANGKPRKNKYKRCTDVWVDITEASQSSKERFKLPDGTAFPTVKAMKLCERIIQASSNKGDKVFIPFGGSGSEAVVCTQLQREYVLTEIEQLYIEHVILPRVKKCV